MKNKVCIIGSGNWGSAIALAVGVNTAAHPDIFERQVRWRRSLQMRAHAFLVLLLSSFATFGRFPCIALKNWLRAANSPRSSIPLTRTSSMLLQRVHEFYFVTVGRYLPGRLLPENVVAVPDICEAARGTFLLVCASLGQALTVFLRCNHSGGGHTTSVHRKAATTAQECHRPNMPCHFSH